MKINRFNRNGRILRENERLHIEWFISYWDGPISGICIHNNSMCYFNSYDTEDCDRIYYVFQLNLFQKIYYIFRQIIWTSSYGGSNYYFKNRRVYHYRLTNRYLRKIFMLNKKIKVMLIK